MNQDLFQNLQSEIVIDILSRLPVRSVISCKCVQKSWLHLIETQEFVKLHLSKSVPGLAIECYNQSKSYKFFEFEDVSDDIHYKLVTEFDLTGHERIMGSIDGLLFLYRPGAPSICNPITREYINLHSPLEASSNHDIAVWGFGSSKMTNQYKVVKIFHDEYHVHTLGTRLWRRHTSCATLVYSNLGIDINDGVFANGNLHWPVYDINRCPMISCFDLETEHFSTLSTPHLHWNGDSLSIYAFNLFAWGDCLGLCDNTLHDKIVIWLMKEYGDEKSWTKEFVIPNVVDGERLVPSYPIKVFNNGDILIVWNGSCLAYYSSKTGTNQKVDMFRAYDCDDMSATLHTPNFVSLRSFALEDVNSF